MAGVTLPLSLIASFGIMYFAGFSLDNLSLMALTIATGFVVDDAIVMIENIMRHIENGDKPMDAAYKGAGEIGFTIVSLTVSLIAVFIPLLFMTGIVGRLFREFALTLTIAVLTSMVIALTLTPMMSGRLLRAAPHGARAPWYARLTEAPLNALTDFYRVTLDIVLRFRRLTLIVAAATLVLTVVLYLAIPKGFLPDQDTGFLTADTVTAPDVSFERMKALQASVEDVIRKDPDVLGVVSVVGTSTTNATPNVAHFALTLKPKNERLASATEIMQRLTTAARQIPGIYTTFQVVQDIQIGTARSSTQYQYVLVGLDRQGFSGWAKKLTAELKQDNRLSHVSSDIQEDGNAVMINIDRVIAGRLGVTMQALNDTLYDAFGQRQVSTIYGQSNQYRVVLEVDPKYQKDIAALGSIYVPGNAISNSTGGNATTGLASASSGGATSSAISAVPAVGQGRGAQVPFSSFATIERTIAPLSVNHVQQYPAATISFDAAPGVSLDAAVQAIADANARIGMPASIAGSFTGAAAEFNCVAEKPAAADPGRARHHLHHPRRSLRKLHPSLHDPDAPCLPPASARSLALLLFGMEFSFIALDRRRPADGHREEERHHHDRLRHRCAAAPGHGSGGGDPGSVPVALPAHHDDDGRGTPGRASAGDQQWPGLGASHSAGRHHHRRPAAEPASHALHHAGDLPRHGGCENARRKLHGLDRRARRRASSPPPKLEARDEDGGVRLRKATLPSPWRLAEPHPSPSPHGRGDGVPTRQFSLLPSPMGRGTG